MSVSRRRQLTLLVRLFGGVAALGLPAAAESLGVEIAARAVAQVLDLVADERGHEAVGFGFGHPLRQLLQPLDVEESTDARADLAALEDGGAFGERLVGA